MTDHIETAYWDESSAHGHEIARYEPGLSPGVFTWPKPSVTLDNWASEAILVVKADGIVAGRAVLEAMHYPLAELVNMQIFSHFRGRGLGSRLVEDLVRRAAELGYLAVHLQTKLDNRTAHGLYSKHGFLPAQQGTMLRMVRFLNYPALSQFLRDHPLAVFDTRPGDREWDLSWTDPVSRESVTIGLSGGSCQGDSDSIGPGVSSFRLQSAEMGIEARVSGADSVARGEDFNLSATISNDGESAMKGRCRLLLNQGFTPISEGSLAFEAGPGESREMEFAVKVQESFDRELFKEASYPSVPVAAEFFVGERIFWLCRQIKISSGE